MSETLGFYIGGLPIFAGNILKLGGLAFILAEYYSRVGCGFLVFMGFTPCGGFERFGSGMLSGICLVGAVFLGLACTGLFSPAGIILALLAVAAGTRGILRSRMILLEAGGEWIKGGRAGLFLLLLGIAPVIYFLFVPSLEQDGYMYHLGAPAQFLNSHRIIIDLIPLTFHYALSIEMTHAIPLLLGDDRLASFMIFLSFVAACTFFRAMYGRKQVGLPAASLGEDAGKPAAGGIERWTRQCRNLLEGDLMWAGILLAFSSSIVLSFIGTSKTDVAATSVFIAGILLWEARKWPAAAVLFGFCIAAKVAYAPFVAVWMLFRFRSFKVFFLAGLLAALPILPWWFKSYIAVGNPLFPVAQGLFHMWNWGIENMGAYDTYCAGLVWKDTFSMGGVLGAWFRSMRTEHLPVLLILPGLIIIRGTRWAVLALILAQLIILRTGHISRYYIPAIIFFSLIAARELPRALRGGRVIVLLMALISVIRVWSHPGFNAEHARNAFTPVEAGFKVWMSSYWSAVVKTRELNPGRILSVGELRTYRLPGRIIYNGFLGETPFVWKAVRDSRDQNEFARKVRQTGAKYLLYNYVSAEWTQKYSGDYFGWDKRMIDVYREYCRSRLEYNWDSGACDYINGGFYIYRILPRPILRPPKRILQVPGAEACFQNAYNWGLRNNFDLAIAFMAKVVEEEPDIMMFRGELAYFYSKKGDWPSAYQWIRMPYEAGLRDMVCTATYGLSAAALGKYEEAYPVLKDTMKNFVFAGNVVPITMSLVCFGRAIEASRRSDAIGVEKYLDEGEQALVKLPFPVTKTDQRDMDIRLALLRGLRGDLLAWRGECDKAAVMYRDALRLGSGLPSSDAWRNLAADPCRGRGRARPAIVPSVFPRP